MREICHNLFRIAIRLTGTIDGLAQAPHNLCAVTGQISSPALWRCAVLDGLVQAHAFEDAGAKSGAAT